MDNNLFIRIYIYMLHRIREIGKKTADCVKSATSIKKK